MSLCRKEGYHPISSSFFSFFASVPCLTHFHPFKNSLTTVHYANEWLTGVMGSRGMWRGTKKGEGDKDEQNQ
jgi:hypothetical protein